MFELVPVFWTVFISFLSGVITISAALRLVTSRRKKIAFDSYSYVPLASPLPSGIEYLYQTDQGSFESIFINRVFFKNETGEALAAATLLEPISIWIEGAGKLILARVRTH